MAAKSKMIYWATRDSDEMIESLGFRWDVTCRIRGLYNDLVKVVRITNNRVLSIKGTHEAMDASRSTRADTLKKLLALGLLEKVPGGYRLTEIGCRRRKVDIEFARMYGVE